MIPAHPPQVREWLVQVVVYLPSFLANKPVFAGILKVGSEDTPSVLAGSEGIRRNPKTTAVQPICAFGSSG